MSRSKIKYIDSEKAVRVVGGIFEVDNRKKMFYDGDTLAGMIGDCDVKIIYEETASVNSLDNRLDLIDDLKREGVPCVEMLSTEAMRRMHGEGRQGDIRLVKYFAKRFSNLAKRMKDMEIFP